MNNGKLRIVISPFSRPVLQANKQNIPKDLFVSRSPYFFTNSKNYIYWPELLSLMLHDEVDRDIYQISLNGEPIILGLSDNYHILRDINFYELRKLIESSDYWMSVDNFLPHFCAKLGKPGIVIFIKSLPNLFSYPSNLNIYPKTGFIRKEQYDVWEVEPVDIDANHDPEYVFNMVKMFEKFCFVM